MKTSIKLKNIRFVENLFKVRLPVIIIVFLLSTPSFALKFKMDKKNRVFLESSVRLQTQDDPYFKVYSFVNSSHQGVYFDVLREDENNGELDLHVRVALEHNPTLTDIEFDLQLKLQQQLLRYRVERIQITFDGQTLAAEKYLILALMNPKAQKSMNSLNSIVKQILGVLDGIELPD